jgi:fluoride exporter
VSRLLLAVALGSGLGGVARVVLGNAVQARAAGAFPLGTFVVNVSGSVALGFLMRYTMASPTMSTEMRVMLTTGFCGGYTTFSTFSYETLTLIEAGDYRRASLYAAASVVLAIIATLVGVWIAGEMLRTRAP